MADEHAEAVARRHGSVAVGVYVVEYGEFIEHQFEIFFRNPLSAVVDRQLERAVGRTARRYTDFAAGGCVFEGIRHEVHHNFAEARHIGVPTQIAVFYFDENVIWFWRAIFS